MAIVRQDEILNKALPTDETVIPRYDIQTPDGTTVAENATITLKNQIIQVGMPYNKNFANEVLAASGTTTGTASALLLSQGNFVLQDGACVRIKLHVNIAASATLNINGTGAKPIVDSKGVPVKAGAVAGAWLTLIYNGNSFTLQGEGGTATYTATVTTAWNGTSAPYTQTVTVAGILSSDIADIAPVYDTTLETAIAQQAAWSMVSKADTGEDSITFTCFSDKPTVAIPVQIRVVR